jgi:7-carboxy-7-deazaguanine synthase
MINDQPSEKRSTAALLSVHSIFRTIQGEGPFTGTPCAFIRLAGCNLQCLKCDTDYTSTRTWYDVEAILKHVRDLNVPPSARNNRKFVVVTGGEPFRQSLTNLLLALVREGYYVQIETNGTLPPSPQVPFNQNTSQRLGTYIVVSPKAGKVHSEIWYHACCAKYVMACDSVCDDGLPGNVLLQGDVKQVARPPPGWRHPVYLQPQDDQSEAINLLNLKACLNSCLTHGYTLQLQTHKIVGLP